MDYLLSRLPCSPLNYIPIEAKQGNNQATAHIQSSQDNCTSLSDVKSQENFNTSPRTMKLELQNFYYKHAEKVVKKL